MRTSLQDTPDATIDRAFSLVAFLAHRHLLDHMRRLSAALDADLDSVMIWGTLVQLNVANTLLPGVDPRHVLTEDGNLVPASVRPVRLSHLALVAGLPRETVRRKLEALREAGHVERDHHGTWRFAQAGLDAPTRGLVAESVRRLMAVADQIRHVLGHVQAT